MAIDKKETLIRISKEMASIQAVIKRRKYAGAGIFSNDDYMAATLKGAEVNAKEIVALGQRIIQLANEALE